MRLLRYWQKNHRIRRILRCYFSFGFWCLRPSLRKKPPFLGEGDRISMLPDNILFLRFRRKNDSRKSYTLRHRSANWNDTCRKLYKNRCRYR